MESQRIEKAADQSGVFTIRRSVYQDKEKIEMLFIKMLRSIYHTEDAEGYEKGYLDKFYAGSGDRILAAVMGKELVGYLSIEEHCEEEHFLYLDDCSVEEDCRNLGIGTAFLKEAEKYAEEKKAAYIDLHVEQSNQGAIRLYERMGYRIQAEEGSRYRMRLNMK